MLALLLACHAPPPPDFTSGREDDASSTSGDESDSGGDDTGDGTTDPDSEGEDYEGPPRIEETERANLLVIHTDTLRKQSFTAFGGEFQTLPRLADRKWLAVDGVVGSGNWTGISTASFLTANPPHIHDVRYVDLHTGRGNRNVPVGATLADHLREEGYQTLLVTGNSLLEVELSGQTGFGELVQLPTVAGQSNAVALADRAATSISRMDRDEPFFVMVQAMDPHFPYAIAPEESGAFVDPARLPFDSNRDGLVEQGEVDQLFLSGSDAERAALTELLQALYAERALALDRAVSDLLDELDALGELENTVVVLTSDHGESLNDRGDQQIGHGWNLHPELIQLPLLISGPGNGAGHVTCTGENADVGPTLLRAIGAAPMAGVEGAALQDDCREWARSAWYADNTGEAMQVAVSGNGIQVVANCTDSMFTAYDLMADPFGRVTVPSNEIPDHAYEALAGLAGAMEQRLPDVSCPAIW